MQKHSSPSAANTIACSDCRLSSLCLPQGLNLDELTKVDHIIKHRPLLTKGECLYHTQEPFKSIYVVRSGCIKTTMLTEQGEEKITGFYLAGDIVGIDGIDEGLYQCSAMALNTTSLCQIPFDKVERLTLQVPRLQHYMFKAMSREIVSEQQTMVILNKNKAQMRIAAFLLCLGHRLKRQKLSPSHWSLPMSRKDLSNYLGLTIETTSRVFSKLHQQGIINLDKREVQIKEVEKLEALAGGIIR